MSSHSQPRWPEPKTQPPATFPGALEDNIRSGWAAQLNGVPYGAPTESRSNGKVIEGNLNKWDQADLCVDGALDPFNFDAKLNRGCAPYQISQPGISQPQS